jgi:transposase
MSTENIWAIIKEGPSAIFQLIQGLLATIGELSERIQQLLTTIAELNERIKAQDDQLHKNSRNSSKPPSTDGYSRPLRPASTRSKTDRPSGGQKGHPGHTMEMTDDPDHIIVHHVDSCKRCNRSLADTPVAGYERHQVFDIPPVKIEVTERQAEIKHCPDCGCINKADIPADAREPVQYGPQIKAWAVYFNQYQLLPLERTSEIFSDLFGHPFSQASIINAVATAYNLLEPFEKEIKSQLLAQPVIHCDETGVHVNKTLQWVHVTSTDKLTFLAIHPKRGKDATRDIGILPNYQGTVVHDGLSSYFQYNNCRHSLCNGHHLRELTGVEEQGNQLWSTDMKKLLSEIKGVVDDTKPVADKLSPEKIAAFEENYKDIPERGFAENPLNPPSEPERKGRKKQTKAKNLLDRLNKRSTPYIYV